MGGKEKRKDRQVGTSVHSQDWCYQAEDWDEETDGLQGRKIKPWEEQGMRTGFHLDGSSEAPAVFRV